MNTDRYRPIPSFGEFVGLMALMTSLVALSIDAVLPALPEIGKDPLWALMIYFLMSFFCIGIWFGNLNALAMEPLGHIAGLGAAVVGSLSTFISLLLGTLIRSELQWHDSTFGGRICDPQCRFSGHHALG